MNADLLIALLVTVGLAGATMLLGWCYFRRCAIPRPPIGVITLGDVSLILVGIVAGPFIYLALPPGLAAGLLGLVLLGMLQLTLEPLAGSRRSWLAAALLTAVDLVAWLRFGPSSAPTVAANNVVLVIATVGIANLWAQSGLRARDAAVLAGALTIYDEVFTSQLTVMASLFGHLGALPFAPLGGWPVGDGGWLAVGAGDLLVMTVFPLVLGRAFGRGAALLAMALGFGTLAAMLMAVALGLVASTFPAMLGLGPVCVLQYLVWATVRGPERTTWQYRLAERVGAGATPVLLVRPGVQIAPSPAPGAP